MRQRFSMLACFALSFGLLLVASFPCFAKPSSEPAKTEQKLPNILWITSEDNSTQWLGCYGNQEAQTPRLDALAEQGIKFTQAYSNAPVCAVARSTILTGVCAPTLGTQHMRSRHVVPQEIRPHVSYLHDLGYYCCNNSKTDYNLLGDDKAIWDDCSKEAHYKNRSDGAPFFAIFNLHVSHESCLFPANVTKNRKRGKIAKEPSRDPSSISVPPYLPDLPEVRNDIAIYHDVMTALDTEIGDLLDELEEAGLSDDTIIFYYGDHGGPTPRGKRYLMNTGVQIPLLVHVPKKWRHLTSFQRGESVDEIVCFADLTPTLLSICAIEVPSHMTGRPFMGEARVEPDEQETVFLFADRFDEVYGMRRGYTDGRYKYIRRFSPNLPAAAYCFYPFGMPSWVAWRKAYTEGELSGIHNDIWEPNQPVELLFDTESDPWEVKNLAGDSGHTERLALMRDRLKMLMVENRDTGLIPEPMFETFADGKPLYEVTQSAMYDINRYIDFAFLATARDALNLPLFVEALTDEDPIIRYWAATGCLILGEEAESKRNEVAALLEDEVATVRITAAQALVAIDGSQQGISLLLNNLKHYNELANEYEKLHLINAIVNAKIEDQIPDSWIKQALLIKDKKSYVRRYAERINLAR